MAAGKWGTGQPILQETFVPTAAVVGARWVDDLGNQIAVAGVRARGISDLFAGAVAAADVVNLRPIQVITLGSGVLELGGTVAAGNPLTTDNVGRGVLWTPGSGQNINGFAREAGVLNDRIRVFVMPMDSRLVAGQSVLVAGASTVALPLVAASSIIILSRGVGGGTVGDLKVNVITAGTGFTIASANGADTSTVNWCLVN